MNKKLFTIGASIISLLALGVLLTILLAKPATFRGTSYAEPFPPAPEIQLTKADGSTFHLSAQTEKISLIFFGYTSCPDFCPTTLAQLKQVMDALDNDAEKVQVLFITVNPEKDTPEITQQYAQRFDTSFIGLSGNITELEPIWRNFGITREVTQQESALGTIINHTVRLYLIDLDNNLRLSYAYGTNYQDIVYDIEILLDQAQ